MMIIGGIVGLAGVWTFRDEICKATNFVIPLLCDGPKVARGSVPWGGGIQRTKAGIRYLAGPDDLPDAYPKLSPEQEAEQASMYAGYY